MFYRGLSIGVYLLNTDKFPQDIWPNLYSHFNRFKRK